MVFACVLYQGNEVRNMNDDKVKELLKQSASSLEPLAGCPDDYQLASYMDGGLSEQGHAVFESHAADCDYCIERIGILGRAREAESTVAMPQQSSVRSGKQSQWQQAPRWAAAALVVIAVGFVATQQLAETNLPVSTEQAAPEFVTERFVKQVSPFPKIISPLEDSLVDPSQLVFEWKAVPDSLFYDIRIVSDDGALISRERVWGTQWPLPTDMHLQPGAEYFVRVDAFVSEGKSISSEHTVFKVVDK